MAAGQAEQLDWSLLLRYVNEALPRPDGTKIPRGYYTVQARDANKILESGEPATEELQQNLAQVNIEAILPLYTDSLDRYFATLVQKKPNLEGMPEDEKKIVKKKQNLPKKGWVVELRGYTYYRPWVRDSKGKLIQTEPREFLIKTLCHNLAFPQGDDARERFKRSVGTNFVGFLTSGLSGLGAPPGAGALMAVAALKADEPILFDQVLMAKQRDIIWKNVKFPVLFRYMVVENPVPGVFESIVGTELKDVLAGGTARTGLKGVGAAGGPPPGANMPTGAGGPGGGGPGGGGVDTAKKETPKRTAWGPVGEKAGGSFGSGRGAAAGPNKKEVPVKGLQRAEFHIFFVWAEPTPSDDPNAAKPAG
jgi:hypothetical protein